jgi:hypothetical protein
MYETAKKKIGNKKKTSIQNLMLPFEDRKDRHLSISVAECQHFEMGTYFGNHYVK